MSRAPALVGLLAVGLVTACGPAGQSGTNPAPTVVTTTVGASTPPATTPASTTTPDPTPGMASCLSLASFLTPGQKVGQLYMVATTDTGVPESLASLVRDLHIGSVLYLGNRDDAGVADTAEQSATISALGEDSIPVIVAADQEGGLIQRLSGPGFSDIPSAAEQGTMDEDELRTSWETWGWEMARAGVRLNLAPVADTVPTDMVRSNAPIGALKRNFGTDPEEVADSVEAVVEGLADAGVASSLKHFPGLGRVTTNTDVGVAVDDVTTVDDAYLEPFVAGMDAGASSVMVSSAIYTLIDPGVPAVHSSTIITGLLRETLGWDGVVVSDDLGAAGAMDSVPARDRGVGFLAAGGDLVINADPATIGEMIDATLERAASDQAFADGLDAHVARVLALKASVGLVECR